MRKLTVFRTATVLAFALLAGGCKDSSGPTLTGSFSANVTGDHVQTLRGDAFFGFGSDLGEPEAGFALLLLEGSILGDNHDFIVIGREAQGRPAVGTYPIVDELSEPTDDQFIAAWIPATGEEVDGSFVSTGGTISITSSSSRRVQGTFDFDAIGTFNDDFETQLEVAVAGTFDAVLVDASGPVGARVTSLTVRRAQPR